MHQGVVAQQLLPQRAAAALGRRSLVVSSNASLSGKAFPGPSGQVETAPLSLIFLSQNFGLFEHLPLADIAIYLHVRDPPRIKNSLEPTTTSCHAWYIVGAYGLFCGWRGEGRRTKEDRTDDISEKRVRDGRIWGRESCQLPLLPLRLKSHQVRCLPPKRRLKGGFDTVGKQVEPVSLLFFTSNKTKVSFDVLGCKLSNL